MVGPSGPPPGLDPATQSALATGSDPLAQNGLGSVVCSEPTLESQLTAQDRSDCQTSSFVAAAAPTDNYAFDIHIDTGLVPGNSTIALIVQELVLTPAWLACVWMVHALLVALEWCYTIDLLKGSTMTSVAAALRRAQATVTQPWLASVLAVGSLFALYHGIVRRRVAQTVGELLLTVAMMAGGLWVIFNPIGTVGALAAWANQASLGALAAASAISPARPVEAFVAGMRDLYSEGVYAPWCYLEFGDVQWCRDPAQLDPRLRAAAIAIAAANREGTDPAGARERDVARAGPHQRRPVSRPAAESGPAQLDQQHVLAAARHVPEQRRRQLSRRDRGAGGVPHGGRHLGAGRRAAADRPGHGGSDRAAGVRVAAAAGGRGGEPDLPAARAGRRACPRAG